MSSTQYKAKQRAGRSLHAFLKVVRTLELTKFQEWGFAGMKFVGKWLTTNPAGRTERKPRTTSKNMCCDNLACDPMWPNTPAKKKLRLRIIEGLCRGCGNKPEVCRCRRTL